ncbi:hypothetical protein DLJ47_19130 [Micromonospora sp. S4605]|uniref:GmrSD restriction endonuclease domain-containing protein n=1 Tax=Micromonospora sp. S4605 TaxID=1420897 RepID=UPI000D7047C4|nr:DUF262 domain-containing protein [Micromonospora sp. S4605]PWU52350.1 hypothetical protein DLJ47_19130 [Micromonospora sp. S4605]
MPVEKTERDIASLVTQVSSGEIRLPEIQRAYVWKPTQVAKLIESLYRGYPSGSLLFWRTSETPETRAVAAEAPTAKPAVPPLYLLDGQQRLTSLHRVMNDHPDAQIVFNVEKEEFQNQSAATRRDPRWVKVHDLVRPDVDLIEVLERFDYSELRVDRKLVGKRLQRLMAVPKYGYHMEIITDLPYEEVAQIFVRVNSGGRALRTTDLALATLSARWPGVLAKLEAEAAYWRERGYGDLGVTFLTRALTGAVLGRGLSAWSHSRLVAATDEQLEQGWQTVRRGLRGLVPLLKNNLGVTHSSLLPSIMVLLPLVVMLGERPNEPLDKETANGILYWFLVATIRNRYSGPTDTLLGQDIPAARESEPVKKLLGNLGLVGARVEVPAHAIAGRTTASPYFFLSFLIAKDRGAKDWFHGSGIDLGGEDGHKLEYHHIHPRSTLKDRYTKAEINDLANLAFISATANRKISNRSPAVYFATLEPDELTAHFVPLDEELRTADAYPRFLAARRSLMAAAMTELLDRFRPAWLDAVPAGPSDDIDGCSLEFARFESDWDEPKLLVDAHAHDVRWQVLLSANAFEEAISQAQLGISGDLEVGGQQLAVRSENDSIEVELGPLLVIGTDSEWKLVVEREKADSQPLSQAPMLLDSVPWDGVRRRFPVTSSE